MTIFLIILIAIAIVFIGYLSKIIQLRRSSHRKNVNWDALGETTMTSKKNSGGKIRKNDDSAPKAHDDFTRTNRETARRNQQTLDDNKKRMNRDRKQQEDITRKQMRNGRGW
jgi:regulatory protein YycI of two-component signal transduction system YycFG